MQDASAGPGVGMQARLSDTTLTSRPTGAVGGPTPARLSEVDDALGWLATEGLKRRMVAVAVVPFIIGMLAWMGVDTWRVTALCCCWLVAGSTFFLEYRWGRSRPVAPADYPRHVTMLVVLMLVVSTITGGVASFVGPALPLLVAMHGVVRRDFRGAMRATAPAVLGMSVIAILQGLNWLPPLVPLEPSPPQPMAIFIRWLVLTGLSVAGTAVGAAVGRTLERSAEATLHARRQAVHSHEDRLRSLEALSGRVAHELKNPLAALKGLTHLLAKKAHGEEAEHLRVMSAEVERMGRILDGLLGFSRPLEALHLVDVDVAPLARDVLRLVEGHAAAGRTQLVLNVRPGFDAHVRGDPERLRQVLLNLVLNALEAVESQQGPQQVRVDMDARGEGGARMLIVDVVDTGPGLGARAPEDLFRPSVTTKPRGTGLGLPISRMLVQAHGGTLDLESMPTGGARARAVLPVAGPTKTAGDA